MSIEDEDQSPADLVLRSKTIFLAKRWCASFSEFPEFHDPDEEEVFNRYCEMILELTPEERELVFTLTEEFLRCFHTQYWPTLKRALAQIEQELFAQINNICIIPLTKPRDIGAGKSASSLLYPCEQILHGMRLNRPIRVCEDPLLLVSKHSNRRDTLIIMVDDYIGTGKTALACIQNYKSTLKKECDVPIVVALVAQQPGIEVITSEGVRVIANHVRQRGISDCSRLSNVLRSLTVMDMIEERFNFPPKYKRGFEASEALVQMASTPNNTFPLFWSTAEYESKGSRKIWPAPFRRY